MHLNEKLFYRYQVLLFYIEFSFFLQVDVLFSIELSYCLIQFYHIFPICCRFCLFCYFVSISFLMASYDSFQLFATCSIFLLYCCLFIGSSQYFVFFFSPIVIFCPYSVAYPVGFCFFWKYCFLCTVFSKCDSLGRLALMFSTSTASFLISIYFFLWVQFRRF